MCPNTEAFLENIVRIFKHEESKSSTDCWLTTGSSWDINSWDIRGIGTDMADRTAAGPKFPVIIIAPTIKSSNY